VDVRDLDYHLPPELIAQHPCSERTGSRLMVLDRDRREWEHSRFSKLPEYLRDGDLLVVNDTRVLPARLVGHKPTGGLVRCLLVQEQEDGCWHALLEASGRLRSGDVVDFGDDVTAEVIARHAETGWLIRFTPPNIREKLQQIGRAPLPPYIRRPKQEDPHRAEDIERYQTVFARRPGAIAAPTAGLHFTDELLDTVRRRGVRVTSVTLHVGLGTFLPITVERTEDHEMHEEWIAVSEDMAREVRLARERGGRVVACGTTVVRALESAAQGGEVVPMTGPTGLFITPGHRFNAVDALITNFHLPRSTLLALVSAFAGREFVLEAYRDAVDRRYRFYSYGDAMLIV
jgi:S-adenosylmethionine:tRNA ribosyltransferase-isomerase